MGCARLRLLLATSFPARGGRGTGRRRWAMLSTGIRGKLLGSQMLMKYIRAVDHPYAHLHGCPSMELLIRFVRCKIIFLGTGEKQMEKDGVILVLIKI